MRLQKVIFLCTHNAIRSQMAEALLQKHGGERFEVTSAGYHPTTIHPMTIQVLEEIGCDMTGKRAKHVSETMGWINYQWIITVCARAEQECPTTFPGESNRIHWPFDDPGQFEGTEAEQLARFREVRDQIEARILRWLNEELTDPNYLRFLKNEVTN